MIYKRFKPLQSRPLLVFEKELWSHPAFGRARPSFCCLRWLIVVAA